jgi:hypothetical protein
VESVAVAVSDTAGLRVRRLEIVSVAVADSLTAVPKVVLEDTLSVAVAVSATAGNIVRRLEVVSVAVAVSATAELI